MRSDLQNTSNFTCRRIDEQNTVTAELGAMNANLMIEANRAREVEASLYAYSLQLQATINEQRDTIYGYKAQVARILEDLSSSESGRDS